MYILPLQWLVTLCTCLGGGISMGSTIGFTTILVAKLQEEDDPALNMSLEDASWLGVLKFHWQTHC